MRFSFYDNKGHLVNTLEGVIDVHLDSNGWVHLTTEATVYVISYDTIGARWHEIDPNTEEMNDVTYYSAVGTP